MAFSLPCEATLAARLAADKGPLPGCTRDVQKAECRLQGVGLRVTRAGLWGGIAGASLLLAGCTHDDFIDATTPVRSGEWRIEKRIDRVTGAPLSSSIVMTNRVSHSGVAFAQPARLQLACFKEHAAAIIGFAFKIGSTRNAEVAYRFDDKLGHEPRARIVNDYLTVLIDDPNEVKQFTEEIVASNVLYLRIRSLTAAGRTSAEFNVAAAPAATAAAYASCPLTGPARASAAPPVMRPDKEDKEEKED